MQNFDRVAVEDTDDMGGEVGGKRGIGRQFREDWVH
jgi:hypothetical protein